MKTTLKAALATAIAAGMMATGGPSWATGTVKVEFRDPQSYTDIGWSTVERETNLRVLAEHMHGWQALLPDGQSLDVEVLDIDLAGEVRPWWRLSDVRVLTGRVDWPRMHLRWTLKAAGQPLRAGDERLSDVGYLMTVARLRSNDALAYDRRMLDDWLRNHVLDPDRAR